MPEKRYALGEAADYIHRHPKTLEKYDKAGILEAHRTATNRRYYLQSELDAFLGKKPAKKQCRIVAYGRVSSNHQKGNLKNQMSFIRNYANANGLIISEELTDIGSGLNYKRYNWNKLLKQVEKREISQIYITYKDRFVRFGFDWFNQFCRDHGCEIVVLNNPDTSPEKEIINDLISIIHVFACRIYGLRKYKKEIERDIKAEEKDD